MSLLSEVAQNYIALRGSEHELQVTRKNEKTQNETLDLQRAKLSAGIASDLTVAQSEAQLAATESQIPALEYQVQQAVYRLALLLDKDPDVLEGELTPASSTLSVEVPQGPANVPPGIPSELLRRRPDIRQAERELGAATANIGVAESALFPHLDLTGSLGLESRKLKDIAKGGSFFWSLGSALDWPIFHGGTIVANVRIQDARQEQALIRYRQVILMALADVEQSLVAYNREQLRRAGLEKAVRANRRSFELAKGLYNAGLTDFLNVLTAQLALFQSEVQLAESEQTASLNLVALYKALGGGWEVAEKGDDIRQ